MQILGRVRVLPLQFLTQLTRAERYSAETAVRRSWETKNYKIKGEVVATSDIGLTCEQMQIVFAFAHNYKTVKFLENALQSIAETQGCFLYLKIPGQEKIRVLPGTEIEFIQVAACENNKAKN